MTVYRYDDNTRVFLLIQVPMAGDPVYLDASDRLFDAVRSDKARGYAAYNGPAFGIEVQRARDYADYVGHYANRDNVHKYNHHGYYFATEGLNQADLKPIKSK